MSFSLTPHLKMAWLILPLLLFTISCSKETILVEDTAIENTVIEGSSEGLFRSITDEIEFDGELFVFDSWEEYAAVEAYLADLVLEHSAIFGEPYADLGDEEFNQIVEEQGFDEFLPLAEFEAQYGIQSKRQQINELISIWLSESGEEFDINTYPDHFPILSQEARALFNESGQIMIGGEIIQIDDVFPDPDPSMPDCIEEAYVRQSQTFANPNGGTIIVIQTSAIRIWYNNLLQKAETSVAVFQFGGTPRPYTLKTSIKLKGAFLDYCFSPNRLIVDQIKTHNYARFSRQSTFAQKPFLTYIKVVQCDMIAYFGHNQYAMSHCVYS